MVQSGSIIIIHMPEKGYREHMLDGIRLLLWGLKRKGLKAVTLSELSVLAGETPGSVETGIETQEGQGAAKYERESTICCI